MSDLADTVLRLAREQAAPERAAALADVDAALADALESLELVGLVVELERRQGVAFPAELLVPETFRSPRTVAAALAALRR